MRPEKEKLLRQAVNEFTVKSVKEIIKPQEEKFIQSMPKEYTLNSGMKILREEISKGGRDGSAVIVVPVISGEILAIVEPRVFTKKTVAVGFPAGYINEGEDPTQSAKRELREETGFEAKELIELDSFYQDEGCSKALNRIYLALDCEKKFDQELDKDEYVTPIIFTFEELLELEKRGYISGSNSKLALARIERYFKEK